MLTDNTIQDVESMYHEELPRSDSELDPLIQRIEKLPTKEEARTARAQFLALCWAIVVIGWTDGSTGPLLPRIQKFYDVCWLAFSFDYLSTAYDRCRSGLKLCLGYLCCNAQSVVMFIGSW